LLRSAGTEVPLAVFLVDLPDLGGAERLRGEGVIVEALVGFAGH
jgi:adenine phosphoribosyltransferase